MKKSVLFLMVIALCMIEVPSITAWENESTHPAITKKAVERSVLVDFLQTQLGLNSDVNTPLELTDEFKNNIEMRVGQEPEFHWNKTKISILDWLKDGSSLEDVPGPRARHHFYDPIRDAGLDNSNGPAWLMNLFYFGSAHRYPDYLEFTANGISALDTARGTHFWSEPPPVYRNLCDWPRAKELFYDAVTKPSKNDREKSLGSMFVVVGHICHLLEDMGVPSHMRNDFVWGHAVAGFHKNITGAKNPWYKGGHPFEAWMETQIANNGEEIPSMYLARLMDVPPAFSKLDHYWDTGICKLSGVPQWQGDSPGWPSYGFGNPPPEKSWGLSECTNYQFLSYSTIFKENDNVMYQSFPHPAKEHTRSDWYPTGPDGARQHYRLGYEVPHLARVTYTTYYSWLIPLYTIETSTTEEERVYEDYAKRTIPRTIDYTTGLINYFFRGRLSVEPNWADPNIVVLTITNDSNNSGVPQVLKGGEFELYWDSTDGNRAEVNDFEVSGWGPSSVLDYNNTVTSTFTKEVNAASYTLVYQGQISENPSEPDTDDPNAITVAVFRPGYGIIAWGGHDNYGQISNVPDGNDFVAVAAGNWHCIALKSDGSLVGWGRNAYNESNVPAGNDYVDISAGHYHSIALKSDGSIVVWGRDNLHQITDKPDGNDFVAVASGDYHSLAIREDSTIVGWGGYNTYGECDAPPPDAGTVYIDIAAGSYHSLALQSDGVVKAWGNNNNGQTRIYGGAAGRVHDAVAAGGNYSLLLRDDDVLISWGGGDWESPGIPRYHYRYADGNDFTIIAAGSDHIMALTSDGKAFDWNWPYGVGYPFDYFDRDVPLDVVFIDDIDGGYDFSAALRLP